MFLTPAQPIGRPQPLPGCVPRPLCRSQGTMHLFGEDQDRKGGETFWHVAAAASD